MPYLKLGKKKYWVSSSTCLGMPCFQPGAYQHRGTTNSGSRNTGSYSLMCMENAYRGCPLSRKEDKEIAKSRKKEGWKVTY